MKKFLVSLALKIPANFEVEVVAVSRESAFEKALAKWESRKNSKNITEPEWESAELDIENTNNIDKDGNGIWVEQI
ncbi:MAG TPA: hypothetical protein PLV72_03645 [Candidatus Magasanikbacteria bacterium]|nr:hypothetical protein [Candidatus Magasanikbacteria bacterium]